MSYIASRFSKDKPKKLKLILYRIKRVNNLNYILK